jgi:Kef-type K+ transport system membrane component KefB
MHLRGITIAIIAFACVGKMVPGIFMTKLIAKESWRFCLSIGVLMNTRGLVELIALNVALNLVCCCC